MKIRVATEKDITGITAVNISSWKTTYTGIMPESFLKDRSYDKCYKGWIKYFAERDEISTMLVAEDKDIIGFCTGGFCRDKDLSKQYQAELVAIYLEKDYQRLGIGKQLVNRFVRHLVKLNINSMCISVLEANDSRKFYEKLGGKIIASKIYNFAGKKIKGLVYGWDNLEDILKPDSG